MGNGGNRFGGGSYNRGSGSLMNLYLRDALFSRMQKNRQQQGQQTQAQPGMGFTVSPTEFTSGSLSSAAESAAFNERLRDKAVFGSYGKGGLKREEIAGQALSDLAKRQMTPKDRADITLKKKEHDLRAEGKWNWKRDEFGDGTSGTGATPVAGTGQSLGGEKLGGVPVPVAQAPSLREMAPSMRVSPGPVREGLNQAPQNLDMMNMPIGGGMITRRNPDESTDYYWTNAAGQTGRERRMPGTGQALADVVPPSRMDTGMWDGARENGSPGLREMVLSIMAENGQTPPAPAKQQTVRKKIVSLSNAVKKKPALKEASQAVDWWGTGQPEPTGKSLWDELQDYLGYAKRRAY